MGSGYNLRYCNSAGSSGFPQFSHENPGTCTKTEINVWPYRNQYVTKQSQLYSCMLLTLVSVELLLVKPFKKKLLAANKAINMVRILILHKVEHLIF